jgi:hypothetical protein
MVAAAFSPAPDYGHILEQHLYESFLESMESRLLEPMDNTLDAFMSAQLIESLTQRAALVAPAFAEAIQQRGSQRLDTVSKRLCWHCASPDHVRSACPAYKAVQLALARNRT